MSIVFTEPGKRLEMDIIGYEFPDAGGDEEGFDPNWLLFRFAYTVNESTGLTGLTGREGGQTEVYEDASMLTWELKALYGNITELLDGKRAALKTDFMEPYLSIEIEEDAGLYPARIRFVYDTEKEWKELSVCGKMTRQELEGMTDELEKMYERFPQRG
ncbi:MAG: hypothetical protein IJ930_09835 [Lachnospiraceae bacterium]|nr:hypothetical protein [Lachnospiraceae bacterium]